MNNKPKHYVMWYNKGDRQWKPTFVESADDVLNPSGGGSGSGSGEIDVEALKNGIIAGVIAGIGGKPSGHVYPEKGLPPSFLMARFLPLKNNFYDWDLDNDSIYAIENMDVTYLPQINQLFWADSPIGTTPQSVRGSAQLELDLSNWDVSKISDFSYMFTGFIARKIDLSNWDMTNANNVTYMFGRQGSYNNNCCIDELKLDNWDVRNISNMDFMFRYFNNRRNNNIDMTLDLSTWDLSYISSFYNTFDGSKITGLLWGGAINANPVIMKSGKTYPDSLDLSDLRFSAQTFIDFMNSVAAKTVNHDVYIRIPDSIFSNGNVDKSILTNKGYILTNASDNARLPA